MNTISRRAESSIAASWKRGPLKGVSTDVISGAPQVCLPKRACKDNFRLVEPQINADGIHVWAFDHLCPVDVLFLKEDGRHHVRMNRHEYFEILYINSGSALCRIEDRLFSVSEGDLVVVGSTVYHRLEGSSSCPVTLSALFFEPALIRCDGGSDGTEYLTPFFTQDSNFPHVVPARTEIPHQVLAMMLRMREELPASSPRARLTVKTYLKMILMLLVNHFASYTGSLEVFQRRQRALDKLLPLFRYLSQNCGTPVSILQASRICGMSASHFMNFFKRLTGTSFAQYVTQYRVERAQALLTATDAHLTDIAQELGFCDQSYFGSVFRKCVGMTPAEYRRQFRSHEPPASGLLEEASLDKLHTILRSDSVRRWES